jgi:hypothetical protein
MKNTPAPILDPEEEVSDEAEAEAKLLERARKDWTRCSDHWKDNHLSYADDVRFARLGEQWDKGLARERAENGRPVLTINKLPPFIRQVVNDARQNKPQIRVMPQDSEADPKTAEIYSGLIRNIESASDADVAFDTALDCAASGGFGFFRINLAYCDDATFDQDIVFERISNPLTVYPDPDSQAADSSDWNICFVADWMEKRSFKAAFPDADPVDFDSQDYPSEWREGDRILVAEYWRRDAVQKKLILLTNGETVFEDAFLERQATEPMVDPETRLPIVPNGESRMVETYKVTRYLVTGAAVIEKTEWPGKIIPIIPVWGEEVCLEGKRYFRSLIRDAKDAQVLYNVNRTASGEAVARAPIANWVAEQGAVVDPAKWETSNRTPYSVLEHKKGSPEPKRVGMPPVPTGNLQEALTASDEMKSIIGIYDAGIGARSNETSGRAIMARQRESDTSTFHFIDNLARAIRCAGRIIIDLIPHVYPPGRVLRTLGEDGNPEIVRSGTPEDVQAAQQAQIEQQEDVQAIYALGIGRYDLAVTTGPGFTTRREEAATQMIELIRAYPDAAPLIGDLLAKNLDWPGADEIAERMEALQQRLQQPQAPQGPEIDPAAVSRARTEQFNAQVKAEQGQQKLEIDAFNAETSRMKAVRDLTRPTRAPAIPGFTG